MSASAASGKLRAAERDLHLRWQEVREAWQDANARQFETNYVEPLLARAHAVETALSRLVTVLQQVRHDCE